jgi:hypothetical protein
MKREVTYISLGGEYRSAAVWSDAPGIGCVWAIDAGPPRRFVKIRLTEGKHPMIKEVVD